MFLRLGTAGSFKLGPFVDSLDGDTAEPGLAIVQADVRVSKNAGAFAQKASAAAATHNEVGWYDVPYAAGDVDTAGLLEVAIHKAGALAVDRTYVVLPAAVWDGLFAAGGALLPVQASTLGAQAKTDVNTEVLDVLTVDVQAELGAVPPAATTLASILRWLYALASNKKQQTATTQTLKNRANTADIGSQPVTDDGTTGTAGPWA